VSQFIELYNLISETLKDTPYKVISKISGDDFYEDDPDYEIFKDFNPKSDIEFSFMHYYGAVLVIVHPDICVKPSYNSLATCCLMSFAENYENYDHYFISRNICFNYQDIALDNCCKNVKNVKKYIQTELVNDLDNLYKFSKTIANTKFKLAKIPGISYDE